jgi:acetoacetyl-CoA synthetase
MDKYPNNDLPAVSETVACLLDIWSRILQYPSVSPDSDFFDLGGDSLLAVGLFLEIERITGRNFPLTTIYDAPTVAALAELIDRGEEKTFSPLVPLNAGKEGVPFFFVHGLGGTVIELAALGKLIRTRRPVYAVQARGLDGAEPPFAAVEDMAAYYLEAIREVQPAGPYLLGGYSFGGLVALEMARLLEPRNVALLCMVDAFAHPRTWPFASRTIVRGRRLQARLELFLRQPVRETAAFLMQRAGLAAPTPQGMRVAGQPRRWLGEIDSSLPLPLRQVRDAAVTALMNYRPQAYGGKITFLKAATTDAVFPPNARAIWRPLASELELHMVHGDHASVIGAQAQSAAHCLSLCLAGAARGAGPTTMPSQRMSQSASAGLWLQPGLSR